MADFLHELRDGMEVCGLRGCRVLLAVSGGADSVALLRGTLRLRDEFALDVAVGHFDHRLRDEASAADARWVAGLCAEHGLPCYCGAADDGAGAAGGEESARNRRYAFLETVAVREACDAILVAHTADDQVETVLHHFLRGTGLKGLAGIPRTRAMASGAWIARPMLEISRAAALRHLSDLGQEFRTDATNDDVRYTRNRIRHELLPLLRSQWNRQVDAAILRLARQAADAEEALERAAEPLLAAAVLDRTAEICRLDCGALAGTPAAVLRSCFRRLWELQSWPRRQMGWDEWSALAALVRSDGRLTLPGPVDAERRDRVLALRRIGPPVGADEARR